MKRITSLVLAVLVLTIVAVTSTQAQEPYPPGTTAQQPSGTVDQQQTTTTDPAQTMPSSELPATASPMPLVALGGLAALGVGAFLNRSRRRA